jgi:hypothetical protein
MARKPNGTFSVSHSEMQTYKDCKRRWFLQYYMRLIKKRQPPRIAADTGIAVHSALHQYYILGGRTNHEQAHEAAIEHLRTSRDASLATDLSQEEIKTTNEIFDVADILTEGYFKWLEETGADDHWIVKGSEERFVVPGPLPNTEVKGFVDLHGVHEPSGDLLVVDTKVVGSIGDMMKTLHLNEQGPLYAVLMKINSGESENNRGFRVVWNMIKRNKQTARAKGPFYQRYELAINQAQLVQFYSQLQGQMADMIETDRRLRAGEDHVMVAYPRPSAECSWKCPYLALCGAMNDPRMDTDWLINNNYDQIPEEPVQIT